MTNDKQRERLVELIRAGINKHESTIENYVFPLWEYVADYLLAQGIIVPPCKVGDDVYVLFGNKIAKANVFSMVAETEDKKWIYILKCKVFDGIYMFKRFVYGKTVFLSREEAEAKLKEGVQE